MKEEQFSAVKKAIEMIDERVKQALDLEEISKGVGISKYHLHRLFKSITGKTLMTYVRGRRLSMSVWDLINSDLNIIDIANEYQFEHEQSYIRAFKQTYKITPSKYRKQKYEIPIEQKIDTNHLSHVGQGIMVEPRMCMKPQFYVQGIQQEIVHTENLEDPIANKLARKFQRDYLPHIENAVDTETYIGLVMYTENPGHSNYYIPSIEVSNIGKEENGFVSYTLPTGEYAVFRYIGLHSPFEVTYATLKGLYDYIDSWKAVTSYCQAASYHFERMNIKTCSDSYCEMDIYVPITAAG